jgi:hypothetical protein
MEDVDGLRDPCSGTAEGADPPDGICSAEGLFPTTNLGFEEDLLMDALLDGGADPASGAE